MIQFPYGISDFHRLRSEGYLYLDRTANLPDLEQAGRQLVFLRPRRFGKSLLLSMLANYYDRYTADDFPMLFGDLAIGKNPTPECNQHLILRWDFSKVSAQGDLAIITRNLFEHINRTIVEFAEKYQALLTSDTQITAHNALDSFESVTGVVKNSGHSLYLLIDEYDNFANEVLAHDPNSRARYHDLLEGEGIVKTLFKVIKASASEGKISRVFITGVSPLVLSDVTSGYNVSTSIYLEPQFNELCGITEQELSSLVTGVLQKDEKAADKTAASEKLKAVLATMRQFYNGYRFCDDLTRPMLYNSTLCFYYLRHYQQHRDSPRQMLDGNLSMDAGRIRYIASLPGGSQIIEQILDETYPVTISQLEDQFGVEQLHHLHHDPRYMLSLLYFFGVLTVRDVTSMGEWELDVPNKVIYALYVEQLRRNLLPDVREQYQVSELAKHFYRTVDLQPVVEFVENRLFAAFDNRDYRWSNELTVKTAFMSLLYNDLYYVMDSEAAIERRYLDLLMIIRPNMRRYPDLKDIVMEFKYLPLSKLSLNAEQIRQQDRAETAALPEVQAQIGEATTQLQAYRQALEAKYQQPERLHCLAVVSVGFERVIWVAV